tara:strand:+ start:110 stop:250 length:141 start_codon:yes stop_codon:yes gene_type:complete
MKSSQHWKHRLKKKFGMGKQARLAKKHKYVQIESTKKIHDQQSQEQ